jgi:hypothetical protein
MAAFLYRYPTTETWPAPLSLPFSDVSRHHTFATEIDWLTKSGVAAGYPDGTFRPWDPITRQSMAAFLYRLAGEPPFDPIDAQIFVDVPQDHPFFHEIMWMAFSGIGTGYGNGWFGAQLPVSRQVMATFLRRFDIVVGGPGPGVDARLPGTGEGASAAAVPLAPIPSPAHPATVAALLAPAPTTPPAVIP